MKNINEEIYQRRLYLCYIKSYVRSNIVNLPFLFIEQVRSAQFKRGAFVRESKDEINCNSRQSEVTRLLPNESSYTFYLCLSV